MLKGSTSSAAEPWWWRGAAEVVVWLLNLDVGLVLAGVIADAVCREVVSPGTIVPLLLPPKSVLLLLLLLLLLLVLVLVLVRCRWKGRGGVGGKSTSRIEDAGARVEAEAEVENVAAPPLCRAQLNWTNSLAADDAGVAAAEQQRSVVISFFLGGIALVFGEEV